MKLSEIAQQTDAAFQVALDKALAQVDLLREEDFPKAHVLEVVQKVQAIKETRRLVQGLLSAELRRRSVSRDINPFNPSTHHIFQYTQGRGPNGERFAFVRKGDHPEVHPIGSRGWFHTEQACVDAMWEDHDELIASYSSSALSSDSTVELPSKGSS